MAKKATPEDFLQSLLDQNQKKKRSPRPPAPNPNAPRTPPVRLPAKVGGPQFEIQPFKVMSSSGTGYGSYRNK